MCPSCLAKPTRTVASTFGTCKPHHGAFDKFDNPLDADGFLFRPGPRLCGNADCIEVKHIDRTLDLERNDLSYRTGVKLSAEEFMSNLKKERKKPNA